MDHICRILTEFRWLTDLYMLDYFVENQWDSLPPSWRRYFDNLILSVDNSAGMCAFIEELLDETANPIFKTVQTPMPLSLLALRKCIKQYAIPQQCSVKNFADLSQRLGHPEVKGEFFDIGSLPSSVKIRLKSKKIHEISRLCGLVEIVTDMCKFRNFDVNRIVDVGSGLGHLGRMLSLRFNLKVDTIERNDALVKEAKMIDQRLSKTLKFLKDEKGWSGANHHSIDVSSGHHITVDVSAQQCIATGLHACGDLSVRILEKFVGWDEAKVLILLSCCYHKLNGGSDKLFMEVRENSTIAKTDDGFPISEHLKGFVLSYAARELACHSHSRFIESLRRSAQESLMFITSQRAALEWLIAKQYLGHRHQGMKGVKDADRIDFWTYALKAADDHPELQNRITETMNDDELKKQIETMMNSARFRAPIIYSLRVMIAPLVESLILLDRQQFSQEKGLCSFLIPLFDSKISPRNVALVVVKDV